MNIDDVQPWVAGLIAAHPDITEAAVPILQDDGTFPKTPGREAALTSKGLALTVYQIESDGLEDVMQKGAAIERILVPVVIEEVVAQNSTTEGTGISAHKALRYVREALVGRRHSTGMASIAPADPPFKNFGTTNGLQRIVALFAVENPIAPKTFPPPGD